MDFVTVWIDAIWSLFGINWPGFGFSIGAAFAGCVLIVIGLSLVGKIFDLAFPGKSTNQRGGNNKKMKIDKKREKDEK